MGPQGLNQANRRRVLKKDCIIHTFQGAQNPQAVALSVNGTVRVLIAFNGSVAIDPDNEHLAAVFGLLKIIHMTEMQNIESAVREDDFLPVFP